MSSPVSKATFLSFFFGGGGGALGCLESMWLWGLQVCGVVGLLESLGSLSGLGRRTGL